MRSALGAIVVADWYTLPGTPSDMLTSERQGGRRLKTDQGSTAFYEGREFYTFRQFDIAPDATEVIKVVAGGDTIVQTFGASLVLGELRIELVVGGTEGGTFATPLPILPANGMSEAPSVSAGVTMAVGGTHTGGTIVDVLRLNAGSPATQANEVSASEDLPFGFPAGTYYIRLVSINSANAEGIFRARWEQRA